MDSIIAIGKLKYQRTMANNNTRTLGLGVELGLG